MVSRRDIAVAAVVVAGLLALAAPVAGSAAPGTDGPKAAQAAKKKCKKKGAGERAARRKCKKRKLVRSTVTIANCPTLPVPNGTPVTLNGALSPDPKGKSPLGAIWESSPPAPSDGALSFFTAPGGSFSFTFTPARSGALAPWTTGVRVDFAGDTLFGHTLFADRRQSSASCSFTSTP